MEIIVTSGKSCSSAKPYNLLDPNNSPVPNPKVTKNRPHHHTTNGVIRGLPVTNRIVDQLASFLCFSLLRKNITYYLSSQKNNTLRDMGRFRQSQLVLNKTGSSLKGNLTRLGEFDIFVSNFRSRKAKPGETVPTSEKDRAGRGFSEQSAHETSQCCGRTW